MFSVSVSPFSVATTEIVPASSPSNDSQSQLVLSPARFRLTILTNDSPSPLASPPAPSRFRIALPSLHIEEERVSSPSSASMASVASIEVFDIPRQLPTTTPLEAYLLKRKKGIRRILGESLGSGASASVHKLVAVEARFPTRGKKKEPVIYQPIGSRQEVVKVFFDSGKNHVKLGGNETKRASLLALKVRHHKNVLGVNCAYVQGPDGQVRAIVRETMDSLTPQDTLLAEVSPYFEGQTLSDYPRAKEEIVQIAKQIILGLKHLRRHGVIHRDVKTDNILVSSDGKVKLIDWGIAIHQDQMPRTPIGTMKHKAPETFYHDRVQTVQADAFSLGSTLYEIYIGPGRVVAEPDAIFYNPEEDRNLEGNEPMIALIRGLLNPDLTKRTTLEDAEIMLRGMRR